MNKPRTRTVLAGVALCSAVAAVPTVATASHTTATSRLTDVRAASHSGFDRLVFEFSGALPSRTHVDWVPRITRDGSGATVPAYGYGFLQIGMAGVTGLTSSHVPTVATAPRAYALPNLANVVHAGEFEGMLSYGASYLARTSYTVSTLKSPSRVVIDVRADHPRTSVPVHFLDQNRYASGTLPYTRVVPRSVPSGTPAGGALARLFAGPTAAEHATGLRVVRSGATGFRDLSISCGIARVRLVAGCASGGSTLTIADLLIPTLKAFSTVDWVKIYSPAGTTARPAGNSDSIPECLEP